MSLILIASQCRDLSLLHLLWTIHACLRFCRHVSPFGEGEDHDKRARAVKAWRQPMHKKDVQLALQECHMVSHTLERVLRMHSRLGAFNFAHKISEMGNEVSSLLTNTSIQGNVDAQ
jgi:hypothetical protein